MLIRRKKVSKSKKKKQGRPSNGNTHRIAFDIDEKQLKYIKKLAGKNFSMAQVLREMIDYSQKNWEKRRILN